MRMSHPTPGSGTPGYGAAIETGEQAVRFLHSLVRPDFRPYALRAPLALASVRRLLERVESPQRALRTVHIAGSKGKGSTALFLEAVLEGTGHATGTFTSPHLQRWTERFRVGGREIHAAELARTLERLRPHVHALSAAHPDDPPSFFDVATAAALLLFRERHVDYAIMEVGIGGRFDATNVVEPSVTCITSIELEHTDKLGGELAAIAREKAGIIKPGVPVIAGRLPPEAMGEVSACAAALDAPLMRLGEEIVWEARERRPLGSRLRVGLGGHAFEAELRVHGRHQAHNAALALACAHELGALSAPGAAAAACRALGDTTLPARNEVLGHGPWVVIDAAHTAGSARALSATLDALPARTRHMVLSVSSGKGLAGLCAELLAGAQTVTVTRAEPLRSEDPEIVAAAARACNPEATVRIHADPALAVRAAYRALEPDGLLCISGSVYMAGLARGILLGEIGLVPDREKLA